MYLNTGHVHVLYTLYLLNAVSSVTNVFWFFERKILKNKHIEIKVYM